MWEQPQGLLKRWVLQRGLSSSDQTKSVWSILLDFVVGLQCIHCNFQNVPSMVVWSTSSQSKCRVCLIAQRAQRSWCLARHSQPESKRGWAVAFTVLIVRVLVLHNLTPCVSPAKRQVWYVEFQRVEFQYACLLFLWLKCWWHSSTCIFFYISVTEGWVIQRLVHVSLICDWGVGNTEISTCVSHLCDWCGSILFVYNWIPK